MSAHCDGQGSFRFGHSPSAMAMLGSIPRPIHVGITLQDCGKVPFTWQLLLCRAQGTAMCDQVGLHIGHRLEMEHLRPGPRRVPGGSDHLVSRGPIPPIRGILNPQVILGPPNWLQVNTFASAVHTLRSFSSFAQKPLHTRCHRYEYTPWVSCGRTHPLKSRGEVDS